MTQKIYYALYKKSNKQLFQTRLEMSDNANPLDLTFWLAEFCEDRDFNVADYAGVQLSAPLPKNLVVLASHIYDEATNTVIADPNYIEPPAVETTSIPVADPGAPQ